MLKTPAFQYYDDLRVTVYQDDTKWWKFYLLPDYVSIRRDPNGNPIFLLIKYAFSDEDRENNPDLPVGGGMLNMDVELRVDETDEDSLRGRLQSYVDTEWQRLKDFAENHSHTLEEMTLSSWHNRTNGVPRPAGDPVTPPALTIEDVSLGLDPDRPEAPPGNEPPEIELSYPEWTKGTFSILAPSSENLVTHSVVDGPLSMTGPNTAAVMLELTPAGATFFEKTILEHDGTGGTDLLPIAAVMKVAFMGRLPPVNLRIQADTRAVHKALTSIDHDYDNYKCREDDIAHYETQLEMAVEAKLIDVKFDTGMLDLEDDLVQEIRGTAMGVVQDLLEKRFFEETEEPEEEEGDNLLKEKTDYYILKQTEQIDFQTITYNETMTSIAEIEKNPQGTLQTFFDGLSESEMRNFVRFVDLNDPFFQTLGLEVNCFADFDNNPIAFVEVQLRYDGRDENGDLQQKQETFTFTKDETSGTWDPGLIGGKREYFYRWRLAYTGQEPGDFTRWQRDRTPTLNLSIPDSGRLNLQIIAGAIDFAQTVDHVQVSVSYADRANGVEEETQTFKLVDGQPTQTYTRDLFTDWDKPVQWKARYFLKDGQVIEGEEVSTTERTIFVNAPLFSKLDVGLLPVGAGWHNVQQVIVDLAYEDESNDYHVDQSFRITKSEEFKTWAVVLQNNALREFRYKVSVSFKNGDFRVSDEIVADGDQTIPIVATDLPQLEVSVMPNTVDFSLTPVVTCTLRYEDDTADISEVKTFAFDANDNQTKSWNITIADNERKTYTHELDYHTVQGNTITQDPEETDQTVLVIPRVVSPEVKCQFNARQINFTDTPVVEIQIDYDDPVNGHTTSETFTLENPTDSPVFQHPVEEGSPREFTLTIIYHLADGQNVVRDPTVVTRKRFVVPRFFDSDMVPTPVEPNPEPIG